MELSTTNRIYLDSISNAPNNAAIENLSFEEIDEISGGILPIVVYAAAAVVGIAAGYAAAAAVHYMNS